MTLPNPKLCRQTFPAGGRLGVLRCGVLRWGTQYDGKCHSFGDYRILEQLSSSLVWDLIGRREVIKQLQPCKGSGHRQ